MNPDALGRTMRTFKAFMDLDIPIDVVEAMLRISEYKAGATSGDVFGSSGREGYHDDCRIVAEYFVRRIVE